MNNKRNVVLYIDKELVEKTRNLGFNLSKTFENHLKQLLTQFPQETRTNARIVNIKESAKDQSIKSFLLSNFLNKRKARVLF
jgi:hypothetical protein